MGGKRINLDLSHLPQIRNLASMGLTIGDIADFFSVSRAHFYRLMDQMPEIYETIQEGKSSAKNRLLTKADEMAMAGDREMMKYILSRVHGLTEKQELEIRGKKDLSDYTVDELMEELRKLDTDKKTLEEN